MKYIISNKVNGTSEVRLLITTGWMDGKLRIIKGTNREHRLGKIAPGKYRLRFS